MPNVNLAQANTVTLSNTVASNLLPPGMGHYFFNLVNLGPGKVYIRLDGTDPTSTDPQAFAIVVNMNVAPLVSGGTGIRAIADQASTLLSVLLMPRA